MKPISTNKFNPTNISHRFQLGPDLVTIGGAVWSTCGSFYQEGGREEEGGISKKPASPNLPEISPSQYLCSYSVVSPNSPDLSPSLYTILSVTQPRDISPSLEKSFYHLCFWP